jgi:predicted PurR-regulated permease PerM
MSLELLEQMQKQNMFIKKKKISTDDIHGVLREVWYAGAKRNRASLKDITIFSQKPQTSHVIKSIKSPRDVAYGYAQRLTTFVKVTLNLFLFFSFLFFFLSNE